MTDTELIGDAYHAAPTCNFVRKCQSMVFAGWTLPPGFRRKLDRIAKTGIPEEPPPMTEEQCENAVSVDVQLEFE